LKAANADIINPLIAAIVHKPDFSFLVFNVNGGIIKSNNDGSLKPSGGKEATDGTALSVGAKQLRTGLMSAKVVSTEGLWLFL
jgi:hypothetical protein